MGHDRLKNTTNKTKNFTFYIDRLDTMCENCIFSKRSHLSDTILMCSFNNLNFEVQEEDICDEYKSDN